MLRHGLREQFRQKQQHQRDQNSGNHRQPAIRVCPNTLRQQQQQRGNAIQQIMRQLRIRKRKEHQHKPKPKPQETFKTATTDFLQQLHQQPTKRHDNKRQRHEVIPHRSAMPFHRVREAFKVVFEEKAVDKRLPLRLVFKEIPRCSHRQKHHQSVGIEHGLQPRFARFGYAQRATLREEQKGADDEGNRNGNRAFAQKTQAQP